MPFRNTFLRTVSRSSQHRTCKPWRELVTQKIFVSTPEEQDAFVPYILLAVFLQSRMPDKCTSAGYRGQLISLRCWDVTTSVRNLVGLCREGGFRPLPQGLVIGGVVEGPQSTLACPVLITPGVSLMSVSLKRGRLRGDMDPWRRRKHPHTHTRVRRRVWRASREAGDVRLGIIYLLT